MVRETSANRLSGANVGFGDDSPSDAQAGCNSQSRRIDHAQARRGERGFLALSRNPLADAAHSSAVLARKRTPWNSARHRSRSLPHKSLGSFWQLILRIVPTGAVRSPDVLKRPIRDWRVQTSQAKQGHILTVTLRQQLGATSCTKEPKLTRRRLKASQVAMPSYPPKRIFRNRHHG